VTILVRAWGRDLDDLLGLGVNRFQRSLGGERYIDLEANRTAVLPGKRTLSAELLVRCADGYGRPDFTPARLSLYVNQAPVLMREFDDGTGHVLAQYPQPNQVIDIDVIRALGMRLPVTVRALDPDGSTTEFSYRFVVPPYWTMETCGETCDQTEEYVSHAVSFPPSWAEGLGSTPRPVTVTVRILEHAQGDDSQMRIDRSIPFFIVDN